MKSSRDFSQGFSLGVLVMGTYMIFRGIHPDLFRSKLIMLQVHDEGGGVTSKYNTKNSLTIVQAKTFDYVERVDGNEAASQCTHTTAILITGLYRRFIYRDRYHFLNFSSSKDGSALGYLFGECPVDVFLVLQEGFGNPEAHPPAAVCPPYEDDAFEVKVIKGFFQGSGARRVHIKSVSHEQITRSFNEANKMWRKKAESSACGQHFDDRWPSWYVQLYLRHLGQQMINAYNYSHVLWEREDTVYLWNTPRHLFYNATRMMSFAHENKANVVVDRACGNGGVSDKTFFANFRGANKLFGGTARQFRDIIQDFLKYSSFNFRCSPEGYYKLATKGWGDSMYFFRIDQRYVRAENQRRVLCTSATYWHCMKNYLPRSNRTQRRSVMNSHGFLMC
eukprot:jgi/Bigna1/134977/aug1.27_g9685